MNALIVLTEIVEKLILLTLLGLSIWSVSIMIDRKRTLSKEGTQDFEHLKTSLEGRNLEAVRTWCSAHPNYIAGALLAALHAEKHPSNVDRAVASFAKAEKLRLERGLSVLATLGANAPFIGLFGTVLGIIRAFAYLGSQSGSAAVMSGVSQALYATAIGLFVAIPAVISYNIFSKKIRDITVTADSLKDLYVSKLS